MVEDAVRHHQAGRLDEAEQLYRRILVMEPRHADSWHLLGVIAYQANRHEIAADMIRNAIRINSKDASYHCNLGLTFQALGKLNDAVGRYKETLKLNPDYAEAHYNLGNTLRNQGKLDDAITRYKRALSLKPNYAEAHCNLSVVLDSQGKVDEAVTHGERALALRPELAEVHFNLGNFFQTQGRLAEAAARYNQALALKPDYVAAHCNLGNLLKGANKLNEAVRQYEQALALKPDGANLHLNVGLALCAQGKLSEAAAHYRQALALKPDFAEAHYNFGLTLCAQDNLDEGVAHYEQALAVKPDYAEAHNNLGITLDTRNALDLAMVHYERALTLKPDLTEAHYNLAMSQLRSGDFASGWRNYEWRWNSEKSPLLKRNFSQPQWRGEPLNGARIVLHAEQGLGDSIQFLRYLPLVQAAGGTIVLEVQDRLRRIAAELPGIAELVSSGEPLPSFDWHCPLLSLPLAFGTTLGTIPAQTPYLSVPEQARMKMDTFSWPTEGLRIGFVWAGNPTFLKDRARYRSIPFPLLKPLIEITGIHLFSLQIGEASAELVGAPETINDLSPYVSDMADTAAQIAHLDLIITVDTSVAHLAGALGVATWVLLPFAADWRWLQTRSDSPWYPAIRLFRQPSPGAWEPVIAEVYECLTNEFMKSNSFQRRAAPSMGKQVTDEFSARQ
jgi:tetratricopeptide (TPR) repeat protein